LDLHEHFNYSYESHKQQFLMERNEISRRRSFY